ncbi:MAG: hypothetical protein ACI845_002452 [Gammaproteobacteria bacterium]|jgi:hypothetical protein
MYSKSTIRWFFKSAVYSLFFLFLIISNQALAERAKPTGIYYGLHYAHSLDQITANGSTEKTARGYMKLKVGKYLNDKISVEGHGGYVTSSTAEAGIFSIGAMARAEKRFEKYRIYGLLGASVLYAYNRDTTDANESSISWGAGIEIFGDPFTAITLEYISMINTELDDGSDFTFDTLGIGFTYYFSSNQSRFNKSGSRVGLIRQ